MQAVIKLLDQIADAFPRVKNSTGVRRNWVYTTHLELSEAMPERIAAPRKYSKASREGIYCLNERSKASFLQIPFISDIAYMLASDIPNRVERAVQCARDAWGALGLHRYSMLVDRAICTCVMEGSSLKPSSPSLMVHSMALTAGMMAASMFAKIASCLLHDQESIPFSWGARGWWYALRVDEDGLNNDYELSSLKTLSCLCLLQFCADISTRANTGAFEPDGTNHPGMLLRHNCLQYPFIAQWGAGWLVWSMIDVAKAHNGLRAMKRQEDAIVYLPQFFRASFSRSHEVRRIVFSAMPKMPKSASEIRQDILANRKYTLWPGVTDIIWKENGLSGLSLITWGKAETYAALEVTADLSPCDQNWNDGKDVLVVAPMQIASLEDDSEWMAYEEDLQDGGLDEFDEWAVPMEAIRMCCVPVEQKMRGNRIPRGYVQTPKVPKAERTTSSVSVTYIPRIMHRDDAHSTPEQGEREGKDSYGISGTSTGRHVRAHQVAGFIRQMSMERHASPGARIRAADVGLTLPESGFTYVRPHTRGSLDLLDEDDVRKVVKVRRPKN